MTATARHIHHDEASAAVHLMGTVDFDVALALQQRLVFEHSGQAERRIAILLCEHRDLITVGRDGSRAHIRLDEAELRSRQIEVRWINRGGGAVAHLPGQLAVYPIVPLETFRMTVGAYLERLHQGLLDALDEMRLSAERRAGRYGIWGRSGQLAAVGVAVKHWTTYHGAFINVRPAMQVVRRVDTDFWEAAPMSCLAAERSRPLNMHRVRSHVIRRLTAALGCPRYHLYTGHPMLAWARNVQKAGRNRGSAARVG